MTYQLPPLLTVVDADLDSLWVWAVAPDVSHGRNVIGRAVGAWQIELADSETLRNVVRARAVLVMTPAGRCAVEPHNVRSPELNVVATLDGVAEEIDALQAAHEAEQQTRAAARRLNAPTWPELPEGLDLTSPVLPRWGIKDGPHATALGIAQWLTVLASAWAVAEEERFRRPTLRALRGSAPREMPLILVS